MTELLALDAPAAIERICAALAAGCRALNRRGAVLGISGGVDSAVCAALAVRALGADRVLGLLMPEKDCSAAGTERAMRLCRSQGIEAVYEDITAPLEALRCYGRRDDAMRRLFPDYGEDWRLKIVLSGGPMESARLAWFDAVVENPAGERQRARMPADVYREVVAASNMKQRLRALLAYTHGEARNRAVIGTPNRLEYELGFFVRGGDGLADLKPIAHLFKTQVYALAAALGIPEEIRGREPSTDTYSLDQSQEEFYFGLDLGLLDLLLAARAAGWNEARTAKAADLDEAAVSRVWHDVEGKRRAAARGLASALMVEPVALPDPVA